MVEKIMMYIHLMHKRTFQGINVIWNFAEGLTNE